MEICHFYLSGQGARLGQLIEQRVYDLTTAGFPYFTSLTSD